jgi:outer membrane lipoprotein SlyB
MASIAMSVVANVAARNGASVGGIMGSAVGANAGRGLCALLRRHAASLGRGVMIGPAIRA